MTMSRTFIVICLFATIGLSTGPVAVGTATAQVAKPTSQPSAARSKLIERGRYLVQIAGCNDCHTAGYMQTQGKVPEAQWLTGDQFGWRGPWGTTYAVNLRLYMQDRSEAQWLKAVRTLQARPPMPSYNLQTMTQDDLRAIYRYIRHAGPAGAAAPAYVPPDKEPNPPYALFPSPPK
jgi:mono/diheme cytochrome c family protein